MTLQKSPIAGQVIASGCRRQEVAHRLTGGLGLEKFIVHAGDVGCVTTQCRAHRASEGGLRMTKPLRFTVDLNGAEAAALATARRPQCPE